MTNSYRQIENLIYQYAECFDLGDFESLAQLFKYGEINWMAGLWSKRGYDQVLEMTSKAIRVYEDTGTPCTKNIVTNLMVTVGEEQQTAEARSCFVIYRQRQELPMQVIVSGRYCDTFLLHNKNWRFCERTILTDYYGDLSDHLLISMEPENTH